MRPKRNSDEQRSLTQKTNCCLIYFQICRTKRQQSSPYNFNFSCFLYGFIGGKASQNTSFDSQKSQRSPWNLLCSSSPHQHFEIFFYQHVTYYSNNNNNLCTNMHQEMMPFFPFQIITSWTFHDVILLSFENGIQSRTRRCTIWNLFWNRR